MGGGGVLAYMLVSLAVQDADCENTDLTLLLVGASGVGKSTLVDLFAGGEELALVGSVTGSSQTTSASLFHVTANLNVSNSTTRWVVIDTPGLPNTQDESYQARDVDSVFRKLRFVTELDAVVLVWKVDTKLTPDAMAPILFLRSNFGPSIFKRLILVYTFWRWADDSFELGGCMSRKDLFKIHRLTLDTAFRYVQRHMRTSDAICNGSHTFDCLPDSKDIPFVGSDLTLKKLKLGRKRGFDLLDPNSTYYSSLGCPRGSPNSAEELRRLQNTVVNITQALFYEPLPTSGVADCWGACRKAKQNLQSADYDNLNVLAADVKTCIKGSVIEDVRELGLLIGELNITMEQELAFAMNAPAMVSKLNGFSSDATEMVNTYTDLDTGILCQRAMVGSDVAALPAQLVHCWQRLQRSSPDLSGRQFAIASLQRSFQKIAPQRRQQIRATILGDMLCTNFSILDCPPFGMCTDTCSSLNMVVNKSTPQLCGNITCSKLECACASAYGWSTIIVIILAGVSSLVICCRVFEESTSQKPRVPKPEVVQEEVPSIQPEISVKKRPSQAEELEGYMALPSC